MTKQTIKEFWLDSAFKVKEMPEDNDSGVLTIAGYANTVSQDRAGDVIPANVWDKSGSLDNYLKNPIVLFQHDHDEPIGKMIRHEVDETGLFVEIEIYDVDSRVYKLVKNDVLKSFSVGFRMLDYAYDTDKDVFIIKELELFEISVVSIPCNQDSTFSLQKSMKGSDFDSLRAEAIAAADAKKSLEEDTTPPKQLTFNSELEKLAHLLANQ
ncbi:prohead protease [Vibrio phage 234P1]|nr:hypothetical protein SIPHO036v1_10007 [Vibrio phage 70E38.1]QZI87921.1 prohead protease [Vibrio phage 234P1]QZI88276.1 hypothetical protein SIPHO035v1_p0185 [Vibrio phage 234P7B]QZI88455.1 hypothetical protein SIPHO037v1_p0014 [Vibrio phage 70E35.2]QZI88642.1 hypothetical protein SIPHO039v1_p0013 [Vibrio phage 70E35.5a]QZI88827.1 hypothetical protein SIPHO040v1_p0014 [Vibrio phage 70E35.6]QZI89012.1 hypothetical protein SIPHO042v1_p0015 [Vibrio phage 70E37.1]QZI89275.1 hypothetical protei